MKRSPNINNYNNSSNNTYSNINNNNNIVKGQSSAVIMDDFHHHEKLPSIQPSSSSSTLSTTIHTKHEKRNSIGHGHDFHKEKADSLSSMPHEEYINLCILVLLYVLQGIPVGLAFGSIPFILKSSTATYSQVAVFGLATYPYSLKLLWSPLVDSIYSPRIGRRKSWILPMQLFSGLGLYLLGSKTEQYTNDATRLGTLTTFFFILILFCATQDIAVDGWALTLMSERNLSYASTAQTVGLNTGFFVSFTVFLALSSPDFANKYIRSVPLDQGLITLSGYMQFWGIAYVLVTIFVALFKSEPVTSDEGGTMQVYKTMWNILKLKHVQSFLILHFFAKVAFQANDATTNLKLLEKGFSKENLALTVLIDFPFEILFGYFAAKWSTGSKPLRPWALGYVGRLGACFVGMLVVYLLPRDKEVSTAFFIFVIIQHMFSSFMGTIQFVSIGAFHTQIADPTIGGTYMTLLNTVSNLGGTWPRYFVLRLVDYFTHTSCFQEVPNEPPRYLYSCTPKGAEDSCTKSGGTCIITQDGYYTVSILSILLGIALFVSYLKPQADALQRLPLSQWKVSRALD